MRIVSAALLTRVSVVVRRTTTLTQRVLADSMSLLSTHTGILIDSTDAPNIPIPAILTNLRSTRSASDLRISCNSPSREASVCLLSVCQNSNSGKLLQTKAGIIPLRWQLDWQLLLLLQHPQLLHQVAWQLEFSQTSSCTYVLQEFNAESARRVT
jgi:hypothetical protein